ncbi:MAG: hypothetical protein KDB53_18585, partial [Planctomycetes bacterium]|nr:hypothetical protein [Planctomycetota bacterium]
MLKRPESEAGFVIITVMFMVVVIAVLSISYLGASFEYGRATSFENDLARARLAADEGVHLSLAELKTGADLQGDGLGNLIFAGADTRQIVVAAQDLGGGLYRIRSTGNVNQTSQAVDCIAQLLPPTALTLNARAAVTAEGPVVTSGNINVDGRDWDEWGAFIQGAGVFGIS